MKLKKQGRNPYDKVLDFFTIIEKNISFYYLFVILGIFPLYVKNQYDGIGDAKFNLFYQSTKIFLPVLTTLFIGKEFFVWKRAGEEKKRQQGKADIEKQSSILKRKEEKDSFLNIAVLSYGFLVLLSYFLSDYKYYALYGADGWKMGLVSQLMFVAIYFLLSGSGQRYLSLIVVHLISSGFTFLFGILHRFQIDPLGMYEGLDLMQMTEFLSTIGQATWYSSYICTVFPIGIMCFYIAKKKIWKMACVCYGILTFSVLVTQNSDSAFVALAGVLVLLALYSSKSKENWLIFLKIMITMWGSFVGIGILQRLCAERAIPLSSLSTFFSQGIVSVLFLGISILLYMAYRKLGRDREDHVMRLTRKAVKAISIGAAVITILLIVFIFLNTKGYLEQWLGISIRHNYLLFDEYWGNNRGLSWKIAWEEYWNLPLYQKLFGVGPDAFSEHLYHIPEIQQTLQHKWGSLRLTNAHNEYLNSLICYGMVGLLSWLIVLMGGIFYFYKKSCEKAEFYPMILGFSLCIMSYFCHNIFCYQQVCCTPFLFIVLGIGERYVRDHERV